MADDLTSITIPNDTKSELKRFKSEDQTWDECIEVITTVLGLVIHEADEDIVGESATEAEALERLKEEFDGNMFQNLGESDPPEVKLSDEDRELLSESLQQSVRDTILDMR